MNAVSHPVVEANTTLVNVLTSAREIFIGGEFRYVRRSSGLAFFAPIVWRIGSQLLNGRHGWLIDLYTLSAFIVCPLFQIVGSHFAFAPPINACLYSFVTWLYPALKGATATNEESHTETNVDVRSQAVGLLLVLMGLAYFALLVFILPTQFSGLFEDWVLSRKMIFVTLFFVAFGALLIFVGIRFLKPKNR